jgi:hypothetical protein
MNGILSPCPPMACFACGEITPRQDASRADDLAEGRKIFAVLSRLAVKIARGQPGYFVFRCPEAEFGDEWGHWVQVDITPSNSSLGKANPSCGKIMQ